MVQQFIHGTQYIDELVMMRAKDKGDLYVHQDAHWNVIALTDLGGNVVERYEYTPCGELTAHQVTAPGDYDGDGDVDAADRPFQTYPPTICTTMTGSCRILDLDFDGDYDSTDRSKHANLPQGLARHPGRKATGVEQPFAHQGLLFEPEVGQYQNRARNYHPAMMRFAQRDPLAFRQRASGGYQDGINLYQYAGANPVANVDPLGLVKVCSRWHKTVTDWFLVAQSGSLSGLLWCTWSYQTEFKAVCCCDGELEKRYCYSDCATPRTVTITCGGSGGNLSTECVTNSTCHPQTCNPLCDVVIPPPCTPGTTAPCAAATCP